MSLPLLISVKSQADIFSIESSHISPSFHKENLAIVCMHAILLVILTLRSELVIKGIFVIKEVFVFVVLINFSLITEFIDCLVIAIIIFMN